MSRGRPQRGERAGAETIDQSPGDGEAGIAGLLRRAAGDGPAWAAHPCPDHRPRSPAASGVPVRGCAGAAGGGRGRRLSGSWNRLPAPLHFHVPVSPFCSCRCPITPANRYVPAFPTSYLPLPHDRGRSTGIGLLAPMWQDAPFTPIPATESPRMQLAAPCDLLYTGNTPRTALRFSCPVRGACAQAREAGCDSHPTGCPGRRRGACARVTNSLLFIRPSLTKQLRRGGTTWP